MRVELVADARTLPHAVLAEPTADLAPMLEALVRQPSSGSSQSR
jgi:hypothetical protein